MDEELRAILLNQQMISQLSLVDNESSNRFQAEIDTYHQLFPLENTDQKSATLKAFFHHYIAQWKYIEKIFTIF